MDSNITEREKFILISHMRRYEDLSWLEHSVWFCEIFDKTVLPEECCKMYVDSIIEEGKE